MNKSSKIYIGCHHGLSEAELEYVGEVFGKFINTQRLGD
jgi:hypothetical protein